jgi:hypothetical protein
MLLDIKACDAFICKLGIYELEIDMAWHATLYSNVNRFTFSEARVFLERRGRVPAQPHVLQPIRLHGLQLATHELVFRGQP